MDGFNTGIDDLSDAAKQALMRSVLGRGGMREYGEGGRVRKIKNGQIGEAKRVRKAPWEEGLQGVGLNQTIKIEIELPSYMVAGMAKRGLSYREAVGEYLVRKGQTWWQPRFMAAVKAKEIEAGLRLSRSRD